MSNNISFVKDFEKSLKSREFVTQDDAPNIVSRISRSKAFNTKRAIPHIPKLVTKWSIFETFISSFQLIGGTKTLTQPMKMEHSLLESVNANGALFSCHYPKHASNGYCWK